MKGIHRMASRNQWGPSTFDKQVAAVIVGVLIVLGLLWLLSGPG
jgi:hypothetical protein